MTSLENAIELALSAHAGQIDEDGLPHIAHSLEVMFLAAIGHRAYSAEIGESLADFMAAAALHDVVEDTHVTLDRIRDEFGGDVARLVDGVTRRRGEPYRDFIYRAGAEPGTRALKTADVTINRGRTHRIKRAAWRSKLEYKYTVALRVLSSESPGAPAWERESFEWVAGEGAVRLYVASPDGRRTEIAEAEARRMGLIK